jgi:hypothetical protein
MRDGQMIVPEDMGDRSSWTMKAPERGTAADAVPINVVLTGSFYVVRKNVAKDLVVKINAATGASLKACVCHPVHVCRLEKLRARVSFPAGQ